MGWKTTLTLHLAAAVPLDMALSPELVALRVLLLLSCLNLGSLLYLNLLCLSVVLGTLYMPEK